MSHMLKPYVVPATSIVIVIALSLLLGSVVFVLKGVNPWEGYGIMFGRAFASVYGLPETFVYVVPLLLLGLGITVAFRCKFWNIGAEGQLYMGAIATAWAGIYLKGLSPFVHLPLVIFFAFAAGGAWGIIPAILKIKLRINEIMTTIMLNYIAIWTVHYLIAWHMRDYKREIVATYYIEPSAVLPVLIPGTRLHAGIIIAVLGAIALFFILRHTTFGYKIKLVGGNPHAARSAGISVGRVILMAMLISGGLAGLAGMGEVAGVHRYMLDGQNPISRSWGYVAIGPALLGGLNPLGVLFAAILFGAILNGVAFLTAAYGWEADVALIFAGLIILFILLKGLLAGKMMRLRKRVKENVVSSIE